MFATRLKTAALACVLVSGMAWGSRGADLPPAFSDLKLDAAKKQVEGTDKIVVIKFTAEWCGPCKAMDKTTWRDENVVKWVKDHGVAIQVDVDEDKKTAEAFSIRAMPTMVMLKGGTETARKVGFMNPEQTLSWMEHSATGAIPDAESDPNATPSQRLIGRLDKHLEAKQFAEATLDVKEFWSAKYADDPLTRAGTAPILYIRLQTLLDAYPASKEMITQIRDEVGKRLEKGKKSTFGDLNDWLVLNELLADDAKSLAWFDRVKVQEHADRTFVRVVDVLEPLLTRNNRAADLAVAIPDAPKWLRQRHALMSRSVASLNESRPGLGDTQLEVFEIQSARLYAGYVAAGKTEGAKKIAETLLELQNTPTMRVALVRTCVDAELNCPEAAEWLDEAERGGEEVKGLRERAMREKK